MRLQAQRLAVERREIVFPVLDRQAGQRRRGHPNICGGPLDERPGRHVEARRDLAECLITERDPCAIGGNFQNIAVASEISKLGVLRPASRSVSSQPGQFSRVGYKDVAAGQGDEVLDNVRTFADQSSRSGAPLAPRENWAAAERVIHATPQQRRTVGGPGNDRNVANVFGAG